MNVQRTEGGRKLTVSLRCPNVGVALTFPPAADVARPLKLALLGVWDEDFWMFGHRWYCGVI